MQVDQGVVKGERNVKEYCEFNSTQIPRQIDRSETLEFLYEKGTTTKVILSGASARLEACQHHFLTSLSFPLIPNKKELVPESLPIASEGEVSFV